MLQAAVAMAKSLFEQELPATGKAVQLRRRQAVLPTTPDDQISAAFGQKNPQDEDYVPVLEDDEVYGTPEAVFITIDTPQEDAGQEAVNIITGQAIGYMKSAVNPSMGDLVILEGEKYLVNGVRKASPPIYYQVTLKKAL